MQFAALKFDDQDRYNAALDSVLIRLNYPDDLVVITGWPMAARYGVEAATTAQLQASDVTSLRTALEQRQQNQSIWETITSLAAGTS